MARPSHRRSFGTSAIDLGPAILLGVAPFVFLRTGGEFENLPKMLVLQWGIAALALVSLFLAPRRDPGRGGVDALGVAAGLFYVACAASLVWAPSPARAVVPLLHLAAGVLVYFLLAGAPDPPRTLHAILVASALSGGMISLVGLLQHGFDLQWIPQAQPPASTFSNRNMAAQFVAICCPFAAGLAVSSGKRSMRWLGVLSLAASGWYLYVTHSRAAWLAIIVATVVGGTLAVLRASRGFEPRFRRGLAVVVLVIAVAGAVLAGAYSNRLLELDDRAAAQPASWVKLGTGTAQLRVIYWKNTLAMVAEAFPGGVGLAQFGVVYPLYHRATETDWTFGEAFQLERAHNDHLEILAELGLPGFAFYLAMLWIFFRRWRRVAGSAGPRVALQAASIGLSVVALIVVAAFSFPMERAMPPIYLFACMGLMTSMTPPADRTSPPGPSKGFTGLPRAAIGLFVIAFLAVSGYVMPRAIVSQADHARARRALAAGRQVEAAGHLARARSWTLGDPAVALLIARGHAEAGRFDRTVAELEYALELHPNKVNAILNLGYAHLQLGEHEKAERLLRRALEILPESLTAHSNLGLVHFRRGEYDLAIPHYRRVLELAPQKRHYGDARRTDEHVLVAHLQLGGALAAGGQVAAAIDHYEAALAINSDLTEVRRALVGLYERAGRNASP